MRIDIPSPFYNPPPPFVEPRFFVMSQSAAAHRVYCGTHSTKREVSYIAGSDPARFKLKTTIISRGYAACNFSVSESEIGRDGLAQHTDEDGHTVYDEYDGSTTYRDPDPTLIETDGEMETRGLASFEEPELASEVQVASRGFSRSGASYGRPYFFARKSQVQIALPKGAFHHRWIKVWIDLTFRSFLDEESPIDNSVTGPPVVTRGAWSHVFSGRFYEGMTLPEDYYITPENAGQFVMSPPFAAEVPEVEGSHQATMRYSFIDGYEPDADAGEPNGYPPFPLISLGGD